MWLLFRAEISFAEIRGTPIPPGFSQSGSGTSEIGEIGVKPTLWQKVQKMKSALFRTEKLEGKIGDGTEMGPVAGA